MFTLTDEEILDECLQRDEDDNDDKDEESNHVSFSEVIH